MKRVNKTWWTSPEGYYKEVGPKVFEGPFASMDEEPTVGEDSTVVSINENVVLRPADNDEE